MKLSRILTIALACTGLVMAQAAAPAAAPAKAAPAHAATAKVSHVSGEVVSVDAIGNTIVIKAKKGDDTLNVDASTVIKSEGKTAALGDLAAGNTVSAEFKAADGKKVATKITKAAPKAEKPAKK